ncbi:MAG: hypothetical protein KAJ01_10430 [Candidatus Hydrogenedentes bacterium]|nr:hypothetical protein [Candidatus Hydrogenedentota bacterium]
MSTQQKVEHFQRLFDEFEERGGEGFAFAEWLAEIKVPRLEAENEALRIDKRRRHALFNAGLEVEQKKTNHALAHAQRGDFEDEKCELPVCFIHDVLRRADFERERERYWTDYLTDNEVELARLTEGCR